MSLVNVLRSKISKCMNSKIGILFQEIVSDIIYAPKGLNSFEKKLEIC